MFVGLLVASVIISAKSNAKITDKQYGSMPQLFYQDNFDQCMLLDEDALYCSFTFELEPLNPSNTSEIWKVINEISSDEFNYRHDHLRHSICVPLTCPNKSYQNEAELREIITNCYNSKFYNTGLMGTITKITCETHEPKYPVDFVDFIVGVSFICYIALVIFGSFYEGLARTRDKSEYQKVTGTGWGKVLSAFSIPRNWNRFVMVKKNEEVEKLRCLQGVRFYNTLLVILSHTSLSFLIAPVANTKYPETINDKFANLFLSSGSMCVSTNFWLSSFLLCYGLFSQFENKKEIEPKYLILLFIHRYLRLTPTLFVMAMFHATWLRHLGRGPNWNNTIGREFLRCRKNWWTNILYVNNIIDSENMCLPQTWYLALDVQYFIVLLILVMFMKKYPKFIWPMLGFLLSLNMIGTFIQNYVNDFSAFMIPTPETVYEMKNILPHRQWHLQTASIIGCFAGPIVGLGYGYIFYKYRNSKLSKTYEPLYEIIHYIVGYGGGLSIILLPGLLSMFLRVQHSAFWSSLFNAICRPFFTVTVGFALFSVMYGIGRATKYVLEWSPLYVLGRLSYSAYLVHLGLIFYRPAIARYPIYLNDFSIFLGVLGDIFATYLAALFVTLFLELPISELQKLLLPTKIEDTPKPIKEEKQL